MDTFVSLLSQYGLFLAETATIVIAIGVIVSWIAGAVQQLRQQAGEGLEVTHINHRLERMADSVREHAFSKPERKARAKRIKAETKRKAKAAKLGKTPAGSRLFVIDFDGDIRASAVTALREEISAVVQVAESGDEVLLRLESPGGMVHGYGLAASQLQRVRDHGLRMTAAVDKLAASGGYLMACVADRVVAAPFAIVGSIGVVGQLPNFNRLLKEKNVDFELHTAGNHKRTLTLFGENTDAARDKFREELESTHGLFKDFVRKHRPDLDLERVATGEHWHGIQALDLKLVDELKTSDELLLAAVGDEREIYQVRYKTRARLIDRLSGNVGGALRRAGSRWLAGFGNRR